MDCSERFLADFEQFEESEGCAQAAEDHYDHGFIGWTTSECLTELGGHRLGNVISPDEQNYSCSQNNNTLCFAFHSLSSCSLLVKGIFRLNDLPIKLNSF